jgi:pimeloyl-ACP methyl ester carboxylesterase
MIDEASAVLHWLMLRDELDLARVGVLGYSFGSIVAACLARRTDQIARLCLLAPVSAEALLSAAERSDGSALLKSLGLEGVAEGFFTDLGALDPMHSAAVHDRPTLILHGAADEDVPAEVSFAYSNAIELAGHQAQHTLVAHADHFFEDEPSRTACLAQVSEFFITMRDGSNSQYGT